MVKISVIIPAFNAEECIERCIKSVLEQDYTDFELIVVNDGSQDSTAKIIQKLSYKDSRILQVNQKNGGEIAARATGIRNSTGEWLYFLDADDAIKPDAISSMLGHISPDVDMIVYEYPFNGTFKRNDYCKLLLSYQSWTVWGKLIRRNLFDERVMGVSRYFKTGGDFLTQIRLMRNITRNIVLCDEHKYLYNDNNPYSVQKSTFKDYEYEKKMIFEVGDAIIGLGDDLINSYRHWQLSYLSGMMGLKYDIDYSDKWIFECKEWSKNSRLSIREIITIKAIDLAIFRMFFVVEKSAKKYARRILNAIKKHHN